MLLLLVDFYSLRRDVETLSERVEEIRASAGLPQLELELADLESKAADSSFWDDRAKAQETLLALTDIKDKIKLLSEFKTKVHIFFFFFLFYFILDMFNLVFCIRVAFKITGVCLKCGMQACPCFVLYSLNEFFSH